MLTQAIKKTILFRIVFLEIFPICSSSHTKLEKKKSKVWDDGIADSDCLTRM